MRSIHGTRAGNRTCGQQLRQGNDSRASYELKRSRRTQVKGKLAMPISIERISAPQADRVTQTEEGQFADVKAIEITPAKLTKTISAFANSDGGDLYIGIAEVGADKKR